MKSKKPFFLIVTILISIVLLIVIVNLLFSNYSFNEGKYRVSDAIITSTAHFEDKRIVTKTWTYDVSQLNRLSLLITAPKDSVITKLYISDFSCNKSNVIISEENKENKLSVGFGKELDLESTLDKDTGRLKLDLLIYNENVLKDFKVDDYTNSLTKDATVFKLAGKTIEDIRFKASFNINILDKNGRKSVLKIRLELPNDSILENGIYIERLDVSNFNFKI